MAEKNKRNHHQEGPRGGTALLTEVPGRCLRRFRHCDDVFFSRDVAHGSDEEIKASVSSYFNNSSHGALSFPLRKMSL